MRVPIHSYADMILCATCYKRPPVLSDRFCWTGGAVYITNGDACSTEGVQAGRDGTLCEVEHQADTTYLEQSLF